MSFYQLTDLRQIMQRLRQDCPWDKAQTPQSLTRYAIEEAYEVQAAIASGDLGAIRDELGDLLLQVIFQAQMFEEQQAFGFDEIVDGLSHKLIRRHPHVFAGQTATNPLEVNQLWEQVKQQERGHARHRLDEIKPGPALMQAQHLQKQAAKVGFDWPEVSGALDKLHEEIAELQDAIAQQDSNHIEDELGDCLFALVNVARKLNVHSEIALLGTISKFRQRFAFIEDQLATQAKTPEQSTLEEMDILWEQAKIHLKLKS